MQKIICFALFCFLFFVVKAQNFQITVFGGFSNYQGDLQEKKITLNQSHTAFGAGLLYDITDNLSVRANVNFGKISATDKQNPKNILRNLSFSSPLTDITLGLEYNLLNLNQYFITPYIFAGISNFSFNPSTIDAAGNKIYLQPLGTEGQGFYQGRKKYSLHQFAIPFGGGIKCALSNNIRMSFELGMRKTNTDYLDDVSTTYVDKTALLTFSGAKAVELAFRGGELGTGLTYPADGTQRGYAKNKDWYYFSGISLAFRLNNNPNGGGKKSKTGCPINVY